MNSKPTNKKGAIMANSMADAMKQAGLISPDKAQNISAQQSAKMAAAEECSKKAGQWNKNGFPVIDPDDENFFSA